jgi:hypothetical protein
MMLQVKDERPYSVPDKFKSYDHYRILEWKKNRRFLQTNCPMNLKENAAITITTTRKTYIDGKEDDAQ